MEMSVILLDGLTYLSFLLKPQSHLTQIFWSPANDLWFLESYKSKIYGGKNHPVHCIKLNEVRGCFKLSQRKEIFSNLLHSTSPLQPVSPNVLTASSGEFHQSWRLFPCFFVCTGVRQTPVMSVSIRVSLMQWETDGGPKSASYATVFPTLWCSVPPTVHMLALDVLG